MAVDTFFTSDTGWTWWASAFDGEDLFFGLPVERDRYYTPKPLRELMD